MAMHVQPIALIRFGNLPLAAHCDSVSSWLTRESLTVLAGDSVPQSRHLTESELALIQPLALFGRLLPCPTGFYRVLKEPSRRTCCGPDALRTTLLTSSPSVPMLLLAAVFHVCMHALILIDVNECVIGIKHILVSGSPFLIFRAIPLCTFF